MTLWIETTHRVGRYHKKRSFFVGFCRIASDKNPLAGKTIDWRESTGKGVFCVIWAENTSDKTPLAGEAADWLASVGEKQLHGQRTFSIVIYFPACGCQSEWYDIGQVFLKMFGPRHGSSIIKPTKRCYDNSKG